MTAAAVQIGNSVPLEGVVEASFIADNRITAERIAMPFATTDRLRVYNSTTGQWTIVPTEAETPATLIDLLERESGRVEPRLSLQDKKDVSWMRSLVTLMRADRLRPEPKHVLFLSSMWVQQAIRGQDPQERYLSRSAHLRTTVLIRRWECKVKEGTTISYAAALGTGQRLTELERDVIERQAASDYADWQKRADAVRGPTWKEQQADRLAAKAEKLAEEKKRLAEEQEKAEQALQQEEAQKPTPSVFLTDLLAAVNKERQAAWHSQTTQAVDRWLVFKAAVEVLDNNLTAPVFDVLEIVQKQAQSTIKGHGKKSGRGTAAMDLLSIIKEHAGGER